MDVQQEEFKPIVTKTVSGKTVASNIGFIFVLLVVLGIVCATSEYVPAYLVWGIMLIVGVTTFKVVRSVLNKSWEKRTIVLLACIIYVFTMMFVSPFFHDAEAYKALRAKQEAEEQRAKAQQEAKEAAEEEKRLAAIQIPPVTNDSAQSLQPTAPAPVDDSKKQEFDRQLAMLKKTGFIMELRPEVNTILVDPNIWAGLDLSRKEGITEALSAYCEYYCAVTGPVVHLKDGYSGQEVASYSHLMGVSIK